MSFAKNNKNKLSAAMILVAIGIVYGDIATSPMYVMKSVVAGNGGIEHISKDFIIGSLSLVIWTITIITTVKYVLIAMKADNHGEGGIFALYSLVKKNAKWLIIPAMIGGAALLADGMLTPAVTVTNAVEGLTSIDAIEQAFGGNQWIIVGIVLVILAVLFLSQRSGTSAIGKFFGPFMILWFVFLMFAGLREMINDLEVLKAFNPVYGLRLIVSEENVAGLCILGSVFLATTGAEALYADMGHVGKKSIYVSWPFVKIALIINYLGQGAWLCRNIGDTSIAELFTLNPFYEMLPEQIKLFGIILSAIAAVIASQALITGSFTIVSEAIRLNLLPHMKIKYPSEHQGQIYIRMINIILWIGCSCVVLIFQKSTRMESAYGLAIIITLMSVTFLLSSYIRINKKWKVWGIIFTVFYLFIEIEFFIASLDKFRQGGIFALLIAALIIFVMLVWYIGTQFENKERKTLKITDYIDKIRDLKNDKSVEIFADNLVYLNNTYKKNSIDRDIIYSILERKSKRANAYFFVDFKVLSKPYGGNYFVENFNTDFIYKIVIRLGYKEDQRLNVYMYQIFNDLLTSGEFKPQKRKHTMYSNKEIEKLKKIAPINIGTTVFCIIRKVLMPNADLPNREKWAINLKHKIRNICGTPESWYGLENSYSFIESVPFFIKYKEIENPLPRSEN